MQGGGACAVLVPCTYVMHEWAGAWVCVGGARAVLICMKLSGHNPTPGRPQGSPLRTTLPSPLQRPRSGHWQISVFVRAGVVRMGGWDPCGRPRVGRSSSRSCAVLIPCTACGECASAVLAHRGLRTSIMSYKFTTQYIPEFVEAMVCSWPSDKSWPFQRRSVIPAGTHPVGDQLASQNHLGQLSSSNPHLTKR